MSTRWVWMMAILAIGCGDAASVVQAEAANDSAQTSKGDRYESLDSQLRERLGAHDVTPLDGGNVLPMTDPKVVLGKMLFFDKALSGNGDIACATCHHPGLGTSDGLPLPIGVGGEGMGPRRTLGEGRGFIPRNSPDIWNRGAAEWDTMFWDGRVHGKPGYFGSPAGIELPEGLDSVLAVQAMFPPTSPEEMRGHEGENEVADMAELPEVWAALTERILSYDGYPGLFRAAYPDVDPEEFGFEHIANAIAAFEVAAFTRLDSPFDRYVAGDDSAMTEQQKRGANLFFGAASCGNCHNGPLLTDQDNHVIAVPQLGPGKGEDAPVDPGRFLETGDDADRYAFRTPPLRNVELTAPYTHAGAYATLADTIRHHLAPEEMAMAYDAAQHVPAEFAGTVLVDADFANDCTSRTSDLVRPRTELSEQDIEDLVIFLTALTDPSSYDMSDIVPAAVPSTLPVDQLSPRAAN